MDEGLTKVLVDMGVQLAQLAVKGTASQVRTKIKAIKDDKDIANIRATYDELINEVISEREEAVRIAQAYKSELDRIVISESDMNQLQNTVARLVGIFNNGNENSNINQLKELISVDTLKTMQLLGFNYKAAIGEPLTKICASKISDFGTKKSNPAKQNSKQR